MDFRIAFGTRPSVLLATLALFFAGPAPGNMDPEHESRTESRRLSLLAHGEPVAMAHPLQALEPKTLAVFEPHEQQIVPYVVVPLRELLDRFYGPGWRHEEELLVTCADGYQPSIPVETFLRHEPYLAVAREDRDRFTVDNHEQGQAAVPLGPFYLIWENRIDTHAAVRDSNIWPYQVVQLDLIRFEQRFARLLPPPALRERHQAGFLAFRRHCMSCHQVNGQGGGKSRDLNAPNILSLRSRDWLIDWISNPAAINPDIPMPAFDPAAPDREATIARIVDYLAAMASTAAK